MRCCSVEICWISVFVFVKIKSGLGEMNGEYGRGVDGFYGGLLIWRRFFFFLLLGIFLFFYFFVLLFSFCLCCYIILYILIYIFVVGYWYVCCIFLLFICFEIIFCCVFFGLFGICFCYYWDLGNVDLVLFFYNYLFGVDFFVGGCRFCLIIKFFFLGWILLDIYCDFEYWNSYCLWGFWWYICCNVDIIVIVVEVCVFVDVFFCCWSLCLIK